MELRMPITSKKIKNHFAYAWWQYLLLAFIAIFGWNLLFTTTHYRSPESLKIEWYYEGYLPNGIDASMDDLLETLHQTLYPDMEEVTFTPVGFDETYGDMQLMVWASAGQGDLYLLSRERFQNLAKSGAFMDLQTLIDDGRLEIGDIDLKNGYVIDDETGKKYLIGIPADKMTKLNAYGVITQNYVFSLLASGGNDENAIKTLNWVLSNMRGE